MAKNPSVQKKKKENTKAKLQQEVVALKKDISERDDADAKRAQILDAWSRQDPNGDRY